MPEIAVVLTGCDATAYSIKLALFRTENSIGARMTSSVVDSGEMDHESFANFVSLHAGFMDASTTLGLRLEIDVDSMVPGSSCSQFQYEAVVTSVTGAFDNTFAFSGGSAVELTEFATGVDVSQIQRLADGLATELVAARARIVELETLTSDYTIISGLVDDITGCHGRGQILGTDGSCRHAVPTGGSGDRRRDPVRCRLVRHLWGYRLHAQRLVVPDPAAVRELSLGVRRVLEPHLVHRVHRPFPEPPPRHVHDQRRPHPGVPGSHLRRCQGQAQRHLLAQQHPDHEDPARTRNPCQAFCFNDNFGGWTRPARGGWEILHVQAGGWGYGGRAHRKSNRELRNRANTAGYGMRNIEPPDLANPVTQYSQMGQNWVERSRENGWEWGKFMAKIYGDGITNPHYHSLHGQDNTSSRWDRA